MGIITWVTSRMLTLSFTKVSTILSYYCLMRDRGFPNCTASEIRSPSFQQYDRMRSRGGQSNNTARLDISGILRRARSKRIVLPPSRAEAI
jgi:hypothetical protein